MDLMTIIMVFFVIIWSLSQGKDVGISETVGDVSSRLIDLPGDVLFSPGSTSLSGEGRSILGKLFKDESGKGVLNFENNGLTKRMIVFHGHTDSDGTKSANLTLAYKRALSAYHDVRAYNKDLDHHVVICSHADNTSAEDVPQFSGTITPDQRKILKEIKGKNRRITIEDRTVNLYKESEEP